MKVGDLVRRAEDLENMQRHDYGIGLIVGGLPKAIVCGFEEDIPRWKVLWSHPRWVMEDGSSVEYQVELEVVSETVDG